MQVSNETVQYLTKLSIATPTQINFETIINKFRKQVYNNKRISDVCGKAGRI